MNEIVKEAFGIHGKIELLPGGIDLKTYRSGNIVLRNLGKDGEEAGVWNAELFDQVQEDGFRVAKPIRANDGSWVVHGWVAEHFLQGRHSTRDDVSVIISTANHFHDAIKGKQLPEYRKHHPTIWDRADTWAWNKVPANIDPELYTMASELEKLKRPVTVTDQLIHGDLNLNNILISDQQLPAIIDFTPYFHPAEFALAVTAYWIGPYTGDIKMLDAFKDIKEFDQMLIRAGLRMMLTQEDPRNAKQLEEYERANEIIKAYIGA